MYKIKDWADNDILLPNVKNDFLTFDDAEQALNVFLGDDYDENRGEYYIISQETIAQRYLDTFYPNHKGSI